MSGRGLFESLALAQISGHLSPKETICDIDRVTSLGFAPVLGSLLIRLKGGNDAASYIPARQLIADRLYNIGRRKNWGDIKRMERVADEAIRFWLVGEICGACGGRGVIPHAYTGEREDDAGTTCGKCSGTGKADRDALGRAVAMHRPGEIPKRLAEILDAADGILGRAARIATGISRWKLYGRD